MLYGTRRAVVVSTVRAGPGRVHGAGVLVCQPQAEGAERRGRASREPECPGLQTRAKEPMGGRGDDQALLARAPSHAGSRTAVKFRAVLVRKGTMETGCACPPGGPRGGRRGWIGKRERKTVTEELPASYCTGAVPTVKRCLRHSASCPPSYDFCKFCVLRPVSSLFCACFDCFLRSHRITLPTSTPSHHRRSAFFYSRITKPLNCTRLHHNLIPCFPRPSTSPTCYTLHLFSSRRTRGALPRHVRMSVPRQSPPISFHLKTKHISCAVRPRLLSFQSTIPTLRAFPFRSTSHGSHSEGPANLSRRNLHTC